MDFVAGVGSTLGVILGLFAAAYVYLFLAGVGVNGYHDPPSIALPDTPLPKPQPPFLSPPSPPRRKPLLSVVEVNLDDHYGDDGFRPMTVEEAHRLTVIPSFTARCACGWKSKTWNGGMGRGMAQLDHVQHKAKFECDSGGKEPA
jgi:hypothetical protein